MPIEIFYFSGTGNCLAIARAIAAETGGTTVSIADAVRHPYDHIPVPIERNSQTIIEKSAAAIHDISRRIDLGLTGRHQTLRSFFNLLVTPMNKALAKSALGLLPLTMLAGFGRDLHRETPA